MQFDDEIVYQTSKLIKKGGELNPWHKCGDQTYGLSEQ